MSDERVLGGLRESSDFIVALGYETAMQERGDMPCWECLGRGFVKQPRRLVGWSFDPCPRCAGTGKESAARARGEAR